jgi:putative salt-induced outer membrane protein
MKKITLSILAASTLALASEQSTLQLEADIAKAEAVQKAATEKLAALKAKRPQNTELMTHLQLGYINTSGNTQTETFSLDGTMKKEWGVNNLALTVDAQYGQADNIETKNKYFLELEYGYKFTSKFSLTYVVGFKNDKFSSYNYQSYTGPGVKYEAYKSSTQLLNVDASVLLSKDEQRTDLATPNFDETYSSYKAKATYELKIMDNLKFNQELSYRASFEESDNYFVFSDSSLSSKISDIFSAGIAYKIDYTNFVPSSIERTDKTLTAFVSVDY